MRYYKYRFESKIARMLFKKRVAEYSEKQKRTAAGYVADFAAALIEGKDWIKFIFISYCKITLPY